MRQPSKIFLMPPGTTALQFQFVSGEEVIEYGVTVAVEDFGNGEINMDVYAESYSTASVRVFKDGRQPLDFKVPGQATVSIQISRAREEGE